MSDVRSFHMTTARRINDRLMRPLIRLGVVPGTYLLTFAAARPGYRGATRLRSSTGIKGGDGWSLRMAMWGGCATRARPGRVTLTRRGHGVEYTLREVSPDEAGAVLKGYVSQAKVTRPYFAARPDASAAEFAAEADRHPVFELIAV